MAGYTLSMLTVVLCSTILSGTLAATTGMPAENSAATITSTIKSTPTSESKAATQASQTMALSLGASSSPPATTTTMEPLTLSSEASLTTGLTKSSTMTSISTTADKTTSKTNTTTDEPTSTMSPTTNVSTSVSSTTAAPVGTAPSGHPYRGMEAVAGVSVVLVCVFCIILAVCTSRLERLKPKLGKDVYKSPASIEMTTLAHGRQRDNNSNVAS